MNVLLYKFSKRPNSTAQPLASTGTSFTCQLKDETSFINPVLKFDPTTLTVGTFSPSAYNYCQIAYWQRYYYITDWKYINGVWEATLTVDPMASFKTEIGNTSAYVIRSASSYDGTIADAKYPVKTNVSIVNTVLAQSIDINHGCYIVGITNCTNSLYRKGCCEYYAMTESELNNLLQFMFSGSIYNMSNVYDISEGLYKAIMNPMQYITSCVWVPIEANIISSHPSTTIDIGYWQAISGVTGRILEGTCFGKLNYYQLPSHPQISRGSYLNYAPYSKHTLYYPPFGALSINPAYRNVGSYLCIHLSVDCITGQSNLRLSMQASNADEDKTTRKAFIERSGQAGIPIQLSQVNTGILNSVSTGVNSIVSALSGNYAGAASGILGAAAGMVEQTANSLGYNGSFIETYEYPLLVSEFYQLANEDNAEFGKPLCQVKTLNTLSGFIQCEENDHAFSATKAESEEINRNLKEGFFYE